MICLFYLNYCMQNKLLSLRRFPDHPRSKLRDFFKN